MILPEQDEKQIHAGDRNAVKPEDFGLKNDWEPEVSGTGSPDAESPLSDSSVLGSLEENTLWDLENGESSTRELFESSVSFLSSLIIHLLLLIVLLLWSSAIPQGTGTALRIQMEFTEWEEDVETWDEIEDMEAAVLIETEEETGETAEEEILPEDVMETEEPEENASETELETEISDAEKAAEEALESLDLTDASPADPDETGKESPADEWSPTPTRTGEQESWTPMGGGRSFPTGGGIGPRTDAAARRKMLESAGGNDQSERAVERGLAWIARHQQFDPKKRYFGSWSFDLSRFGTPNSGEATSRTAATALALLALMGHGNTREEGQYRQAVQEGIYFLSTQAKSRKDQPGYDFRDSPDSRGMYGHILATLALCEACAIETKKDPNLHQLAKGGILWLLHAQDPNGGGWRYQPHEAGDVSVTAWVVMALKSAQMAGFEIPSSAIVKMDLFMDSIARDEKAQYSYQPGKAPIPSTTAMGLVARVFSGTPKNAKFLDAGTQLISEWGCDESDLYYDYYATLLLRHYGGERWTTWNQEMRDYLILTQMQSGKDEGSWFFTEPEKTNNQIGGRLYTTALAVMILEVYYRYLPIYQEKTAN